MESKSIKSIGVLKEITKLREFAALISMFGVISIFTALSREFLTASTMAGILTLASEIGIITIGEAFLMISGEFDLSVGSVFAVAGTIAAKLAAVNPILAVALALLTSAGIGALNAEITLRARIPSFIATLGMMFFLRGLLLAVTGGFPTELPVDHPIFHGLSGAIGTKGLRTSVFWFIILIILFQIILSETAYGNHVYATGGSPFVAKALGVNIERVKYINFVLCSTMAGLAGCIALSRFKIVEPVAGTGFELEAIAAAVIGGVSLAGGEGSLVGAALGAIIISMIRVGLVLAGAPAYWYIGFVGVILIIAAIIYSLTRGRGGR